MNKKHLIVLFLGTIISLSCLAQRKINTVHKINPTTIELVLSDGQRMTFDFYGENIFRIFQDNNGGIIREPESKPYAQILVDNPRKNIEKLDVYDKGDIFRIETKRIAVDLDKNTTKFKVINLESGKIAVESLKEIDFTPKKVSIKLKAQDDEYFYGGGVQNGRFSHKFNTIEIENQNSWTDGGVASPNPFYWSTNGYAVMWYTFRKGSYDFGSKNKNEVNLSHATNYLDIFIMVNNGGVALLNDFYQLTGNPVLLPKFGFYQGHLNAYNRDYWKEDSKGILFEDGKRYKESQKNNGGIKESLNGELNNYQFSARAVIDRYKSHDMPLGWILPNDGYGAGYGQTTTLDGNIANLKSLADYAHKNGVEIGLWTQSDLHPKQGISALLQRDLIKEVRDAGVRVLKTDVAWVGAGYSFGLNGIADASEIMTYYGNNARPFIISLDGWAGTQRYASIWSGDQSGGVWEYIRFHIPTYIGSGLSGNPNICSDMDGIFGGKNPIVNTRDFQWKTFTPMQLNMDGWGSNPKYPHILGEPTTSINRWYLKMKSEIMPYVYSIAHQAVDGLPMIRAMFLEYPNKYTLGKSTQYQFMYGPSFLIAPIYQNTKSDKIGNDIRNGIYLPDGIWFDYFSGDKYVGNKIINNYEAPIWKLPVFVKAGAIIPLYNPNNNIQEVDKSLRIYEFYPYSDSEFTEYDDDGISEAYKNGEFVKTHITSSVKGNRLTLNIEASQGDYKGFVRNKKTEVRINATEKPRKIKIRLGNSSFRAKEVYSMEEFLAGENVYFYNEKPNLNKFATKNVANPVVFINIAETDISKNSLKIDIKGFEFNTSERNLEQIGELLPPSNIEVSENNKTAYTLNPTWEAVQNADFYEIEFEGMIYSTIKDTYLLFEDLMPETKYDFKIRSVNKSGKSPWKSFSTMTKPNPLEFAIKGISAKTSCPNQGGAEISKLFDFDEVSGWHTKWGVNSVPFDITINLNTINKLDKINYIPRTGGGNGVLQEGILYYSNDKTNWIEVEHFKWANDGKIKIINFKDNPRAQYLKIEVLKGVGGFGSGNELYVFKVAGTESYIPGDINHDRLINRNDLTSYMNYTGLRLGDSDFEGYISRGDVNKNNLIDAYDISVIAVRLDGGVRVADNTKALAGKIMLNPTKNRYQTGEIVKVLVKGIGMQSVNALSFALEYNQEDLEYIKVEPKSVHKMENMTYDRLHTNGVKSLYPTFVNIGEKPLINGDSDLFVIEFKAKNNIRFSLKPKDIILVDKELRTVL